MKIGIELQNIPFLIWFLTDCYLKTRSKSYQSEPFNRMNRRWNRNMIKAMSQWINVRKLNRRGQANGYCMVLSWQLAFASKYDRKSLKLFCYLLLNSLKSTDCYAFKRCHHLKSVKWLRDHSISNLSISWWDISQSRRIELNRSLNKNKYCKIHWLKMYFSMRKMMIWMFVLANA